MALPILLMLVLSAPAGARTTHDREQQRNATVIRQVFKRYGDQAVRVADCESHLRTWARNGQYLGLFQMGSFARGRYGHHWTSPWAQARSAYRYFVDSGRDWSPWSCRPW